MNDDRWSKVIFDTICLLAIVAIWLIVLLVWMAPNLVDGTPS